jgi:hypothetical protein
MLSEMVVLEIPVRAAISALVICPSSINRRSTFSSVMDRSSSSDGLEEVTQRSLVRTLA